MAGLAKENEKNAKCVDAAIEAQEGGPVNESEEIGVAEAEARAVRAVRKRGRPKGSKNKPKPKPQDAVTRELVRVFSEASELQGCRAPYEMDKNREAIDCFLIALRAALRALPDEARATLEQRFRDIATIRDNIVEMLREDFEADPKAWGW